MRKAKKKKIKKFLIDLVDQRIVKQIIFLLIFVQFLLIIALTLASRENQARWQRVEGQINTTLNEQRVLNEKIKGMQSSIMMMQSQFYRVLNSNQTEDEDNN